MKKRFYQNAIGKESLLRMIAEAEITEQVYHERIMRDSAGGRSSGVAHTPTLFVNGARVDSGPASADLIHDLIPALDHALGETH